MFRHVTLWPFGLSLALFSCGVAASALAQEDGLPTTGPDIAAFVRPLAEDLKKPEYSQSRCLLAPILAADRRTIAFSRDDTFHSRDQIIAINGEALGTTSARALHEILVKYPPNATVSVLIARAGSEMEVTAPCSDNQLYFEMLRTAVTAAGQGDAATCADRMADVSKYHAQSATWLNVALQCNIKAGRVAGAAKLSGYFDVYNETLLENEYSVEALQSARLSLQAAARELLKAGSRPLAEKLQQAYSAAVSSVAPRLVASLALTLDADPSTLSNPGIVQNPPIVIHSQAGSVTNLSIMGQLGAKNPVGCVPLTTLDSNQTPPDIYLGVSACISEGDYQAAAALFALAGVESHFDAERVSDKSAGQAGQVLIMTTFNALPDERRQEFQKNVIGLNADPEGMTPICRAIEKIGYPTYYPDYMVLHGIHAFTAKAGDATLVTNFDAPTTWNFLLTNYLKCVDVPASSRAPAQKAVIAKAVDQSTHPNPMKPGLYSVKTNAASQAPDLRNEEALRLCFTPAMVAAANPVPKAGECSKLNIVRKGNTIHTDFSCANNGVATTGRSDETLEGTRRYSVIDLTTTDNAGAHPLHLVTEMIFLGTDCNGTVSEPPATTPKLLDDPTTAPKPDRLSTQCAITQYQQWIRAQTQSPDPDVKAGKLKEIDDLCGSSLHLANVQSTAEAKLSAAQIQHPAPAAKTTGDGFPIVPDKDLPTLMAIPKQGEYVVEVGESYGRRDTPEMTFRSDITIFDVAARKEFRWDLPKALLAGLAPQSSLHRAAWSPQAGNLFFGKLNEAYLISRDGSTRALSLQMPGHLKPFDGIETYAMSRDGRSIAYYLYTRDIGDRQSDGFGKLYVDLMVEKTAGSPPTSIMSNTRPSALAWSPDGKRIAYGTYDGQVVVLTSSGMTLLSIQAGASGESAGNVAEMIRDLQWRPDGQQLGILLYPHRRLVLMDNKGALTKLEVKSTGLFKKDVTLNSFAWSPDGQRMVFRSAFEAAENCNHLALGYKFETGNFPCLNGSNLYTSNSDGTGLRRITAQTDYAYASQGELFWIQ